LAGDKNGGQHQGQIQNRERDYFQIFGVRCQPRGFRERFHEVHGFPDNHKSRERQNDDEEREQLGITAFCYAVCHLDQDPEQQYNQQPGDDVPQRCNEACADGGDELDDLRCGDVRDELFYIYQGQALTRYRADSSNTCHSPVGFGRQPMNTKSNLCA